MDDITKRTAALVKTYRSRQLQIDGVLSLACDLGFDDQDIRNLVDQLAETEPGTTPATRLDALLARASHRLSIVELFMLADLIGLDEEAKIALLDKCGELELTRLAA